MPDTRAKKKQLTRNDVNSTTLGIALYRGNLFAWRFLSLALFVSYIFFVIVKIRCAVPFYILVLLLFIPLPFEAVAVKFGKAAKKDSDSKNVLPYMKKKYNFTYKKAGGFKLTSLTSILMLLAWHIRYLRTPVTPEALNRFPLILMAAWFLVNVITVTAHLIYFHLFPLKATL
ncbi:MAG: hypothetical protein K6B75_08730 [Lachnospiraceae bacterium]|nr:hypothetical protein [Lachnospiraceae bacterium]